MECLRQTAANAGGSASNEDGVICQFHVLLFLMVAV
jgi:hypothetical protein